MDCAETLLSVALSVLEEALVFFSGCCFNIDRPLACAHDMRPIGYAISIHQNSFHSGILPTVQVSVVLTASEGQVHPRELQSTCNNVLEKELVGWLALLALQVQT